MTSACVMIAVAHANGTSCPVAGQYLKSFSVDAYGGRGYAEWTAAITFEIVSVDLKEDGAL